jgi:hypothetical protein
VIVSHLIQPGKPLEHDRLRKPLDDKTPSSGGFLDSVQKSIENA